MSNAKAARIAGEWWAERLQRGDKAQFAHEVERRTLEKLEKEGRVNLNCDYDPLDILLDAVQAIGLECTGYFFSADGILPRKHELRVTATELLPKEGYGNWTTPIPVTE